MFSTCLFRVRATIARYSYSYWLNSFSSIIVTTKQNQKALAEDAPVMASKSNPAALQTRIMAAETY
jgi:hypothetical protein